MGNVGSRPEDAAAVFMRDQTRLTVTSLVITNSKRKTVLSLSPNAFPSTRAVAKKEAGDDALIEYVQDPYANAQSPGILLKLTNEDELNFEFTFVARQRRDESGTTADTNISGLTFILSSNHRELDDLVTREFHADPNLHKHANVDFLGDYSTGGSPSVSFTWNWKWRPPKGVPEKASGYRNTCAFVEYDQRAHKLSRLIEFSFWVHNKQQVGPYGLGLLDPRALTPKLRASSNISTDSNAFSEPLSEPLTPSIEATFAHLDVASPPQAAKADNCHKPSDDDIGDDGPLFRATMKEMESRTTILRQRMKKVLRRAEQAKSALGQWNDALSLFVDSLREVATNNTSGVKPALEDYFERSAKELLRFERQNESNLQKLIIDPMTKLYSYDIKAAEAKKKEFDDESREFYAFVGRYLGMKNDSVTQKKKSESDSKYVAKKRNFEIKRHDYGSFMQDLHGGRKEQEMLSHLTKYAEAQANTLLKTAKRVEGLQPQLETLMEEVKNSEKQFKIQRTEREERRRAIEMGAPMGEDGENSGAPSTAGGSAIPPPSLQIIKTDTGLSDAPSIASEAATVRSVANNHGSPPLPNESTTTIAASIGSSLAPTQSVPTSTTAPENAKFKGIRDLEETKGGVQNGSGVTGVDRRKEGLLWALSRPGGHHDPKALPKVNWHKYWVVLAAGQLCEYSNWKEKLDLHNDPINLRMASVREARNQERRFCFEVITPQYKRVYQATSEDDMNNWIMAINNAVKGMLEGSKSRNTFDPSKLVDDPTRKDISQVFGKRDGLSHLASGHLPLNSSLAGNSLQRRITVGSRPTYPRRSSTFNDDPEKLLQLIRESDPTNTSCADCGSQVKTEWVSINLGIVLCIECSGIHRSLGTHISKVRSLTLDVNSFTPDLTELLVKIGNKVSNSIWEARLDAKEKLVPTANRETRLKFITSKYIDRKFVAPISAVLPGNSNGEIPTADEALLDAVKKGDLNGGIYALAAKGNPNLIDDRGVHVVYWALAMGDPVKDRKEGDVLPETPVSPTSTTTKETKEPTFPMAELLLQNGAVVDSVISEGRKLPISVAARGYLALKTAKAGGGGTGTSDGKKAGGAPGSSGGNSTSGGESSSSRPQKSASVSARGGSQSGDERGKKEKEDKLRKRVSTSGRMVKSQILESMR
ncbi:hypothetical protein H072_10758 [Dactylellina haptotyla CBS 200.50]|uniref:ADP-ribosylation factor GTPase-activating protein n=1 Tax=Dactylellina haptotyla (strain CBS 200.50) TaxID=1284197 RepID=S8A3P0_DACHA|nr:hypothetical protein H072_10758 [Dactylellina haptotyla CBS 200.50]